jgi:hypothetical protein
LEKSNNESRYFGLGFDFETKNKYFDSGGGGSGPDFIVILFFTNVKIMY